jgi:L-lactate dehydrogenase complex protein LldE
VRVSLFVTCLVDLIDPEIGVASVKVLRAAGCDVSCPLGQTCCGQPAWNSGFADEAAAVARTSLDALEADGAEAVVVPAGSCASMMKVFWPELFETVGDHEAADRARRLATRTYEFSSFVANQELPTLRAAKPIAVAYHHSCHMRRELRIEHEPEALLDAVEGIERRSFSGEERCCGFGGLFSVKLPETSVTMADDKLAALASAGADLVCGSDGSCLMHLRTRAAHEGRPIVTRHLAQVLADALPTDRPR